jgi:hypothetical protein
MAPSPPYPPPGSAPDCDDGHVHPVTTAVVSSVATTVGASTPVDLTVPLQWPRNAYDVLTINVTDDFIVAAVTLTVFNLRLPIAADVFFSLQRAGANGTLEALLLVNSCGGAQLGSDAATIAPTTPGSDFTWDDVGQLGPFDASCQGQSLIPGGVYQPSSGGRLGVMAGASAQGLWLLTLGNTEANGGFFDMITLTLTDAAGTVRAYPLPLLTEVLALPTVGVLLGATASGGVGPAVAAQFASFNGKSAFYQPYADTPVGATDSFVFQVSMPNCAPVAQYTVPVFVMPLPPAPTPPPVPKEALVSNVQVISTPPNATVAPVGVPTPLRLRGTMSIPDGAQDVLPITVAETWTVVTCVAVLDALPCACAVADACVCASLRAALWLLS